MRKSELFAQILECVAFETEIAKEQILSKDKFQDVVDARTCSCTSAIKTACTSPTSPG